MRKIVMTVMSVSALAFTSIYADNQDPLSSAGIFLSTGLGAGKIDPSNSGLTSSDLRGFSWFMNAGYQFNPYFALEGGYTAFDGIKILSFNDGPIDNDVYGLSLLGKIMWPIRRHFNIFTKLGMMRLYLRTSSAGYGARSFAYTNKTVPEFGLGMSYWINDNLALSLQGITTLAAKSAIPATYGAYLGISYLFTI